MKRKFLRWICIGFPIIIFLQQPAQASIFGEETAVLIKILAESIEEVAKLETIIGATQDTASVLQEINRGVKEVLRLAETAHIPLPKQVYDDAKTIDQAAGMARRIYGSISDRSPIFHKQQYQSGVEGLFISEDAFEYSTFLDKNGDKVKESAVAANEAAATKLTAETMGVLLHAVSHTNRILAKNLEISSTSRIEQSAKDSAQYETFIQSNEHLENDFSSQELTPLNSFGNQTTGGGSQ